MKRIISVIFISLFTFSLSYGRTSGYNELKNAYYGDTHVHTATSADAYVFGVFADQDQAYRFAQGKAIKHSSGKKYKRTFALDFLALSDHSEFLNLFTLTDEELKKYGLENDEYLKRLKPEALKKLSAKERDELYRELAADIIKGTVNKAFLSEKLKSEQWRKVVDRANRYYKPGKFTTFSAYEWSSTPNNNNLHRIVLFKDKAPNMIFSSLDSIKPEDLWTFLEAQRKKGIVTMAIPHNANLSNGLMFADKDSYGKKFTKAYAKRRLMNEPLQELLQLKGNSETHPAFAKMMNLLTLNFITYN